MEGSYFMYKQVYQRSRWNFYIKLLELTSQNTVDLLLMVVEILNHVLEASFQGKQARKFWSYT
jgi:hypothetical protein